VANDDPFNLGNIKGIDPKVVELVTRCVKDNLQT